MIHYNVYYTMCTILQLTDCYWEVASLYITSYKLIELPTLSSRLCLRNFLVLAGICILYCSSVTKIFCYFVVPFMFTNNKSNILYDIYYRIRLKRTCYYYSLLVNYE